MVCSVEDISEAARTHGGGVSGVSSGITTHETATAMAKNSSPVDIGMFEHHCIPRLHQSSETVAQPRPLQPGSPPGLGSVPRSGHDGCIDPRLGSSVRWNASVGTVVETSEPVAHKPPGAGSSLLSSKGIPAAARTATCTDSHRQYVCGVVYKSPGRNLLQGAVQAGDGYPAMGGLQPSLYQSNAYPRSPEPGGRHAFEEGYASRTVEITPRVGSDDLEPLRESGSGSVRNEREHALPAVLLPVSLPAGRGRADIALASGQAVCISSDQDTATGVMQDQGGTSVGVTHCTELAEPALVPRLDGAAGGAALTDPHQEGYAIPGLLNRGADMLSRKGMPQGEWRLHPESVRMIWNRYGRAVVDLFATSENTHCPRFFSLSHSPLVGDALTSHWPAARLYAFPPIKILPLVLCKIREERASVLLIAPNWPNQPWFPDLMELLVEPP